MVCLLKYELEVESYYSDLVTFYRYYIHLIYNNKQNKCSITNRQ